MIKELHQLDWNIAIQHIPKGSEKSKPCKYLEAAIRDKMRLEDIAKTFGVQTSTVYSSLCKILANIALSMLGGSYPATKRSGQWLHWFFVKKMTAKEIAEQDGLTESHVRIEIVEAACRDIGSLGERMNKISEQRGFGPVKCLAICLSEGLTPATYTKSDSEETKSL